MAENAIPASYKDVYVNSFFPYRATLSNSLPVKVFPLTHDQCGFNSRVIRHFAMSFSSLSSFFCYSLSCSYDMKNISAIDRVIFLSAILLQQD